LEIYEEGRNNPNSDRLKGLKEEYKVLENQIREGDAQVEAFRKLEAAPRDRDLIK
jgi:hypothetical protein